MALFIRSRVIFPDTKTLCLNWMGGLIWGESRSLQASPAHWVRLYILVVPYASVLFCTTIIIYLTLSNLTTYFDYIYLSIQATRTCLILHIQQPGNLIHTQERTTVNAWRAACPWAWKVEMASFFASTIPVKSHRTAPLWHWTIMWWCYLKGTEKMNTVTTRITTHACLYVDFFCFHRKAMLIKSDSSR